MHAPILADVAGSLVRACYDMSKFRSCATKISDFCGGDAQLRSRTIDDRLDVRVRLGRNANVIKLMM